jgi:hypothetical protein
LIRRYSVRSEPEVQTESTDSHVRPDKRSTLCVYTNDLTMWNGSRSFLHGCLA